MTSKTFKTGTVIDSDWLNDVNTITYFGAINVKLYGAKGDGVTDDSVAFNTAATTGKALFVPDGKYVIKSPVYLNNKASIHGTGRSTAELQFSGTGSLNLVGTSSSRVGQMTISGLGLTNQTTSGSVGLNLRSVQRVTITDCTIYSCDVVVSDFSYVTFDKCDLFGGTLYADHPTINQVSEALKINLCNSSGYAAKIKDTVDVVVANSHFLGPTAQLRIERGENISNFYFPVRVTNTTIDSVDDIGLYMFGCTPTLSGLFVSAGRTNNVSGIYLGDCTEGNVMGCTARYCGKYGLEVAACHGMTFNGNSFNDNRIAGVRIGDATYLRFIGNQMKNAPTWYGGSYTQQMGITDEPSNSTYITFMGNDVTGNSGTAMYLPHVENNIIVNNTGA